MSAVHVLKGVFGGFIILVIITLLWVQHISFTSLGLLQAVQWYPSNVNVTIQSNGRLGNQMFELASLVGVGLSNNFSVFIPPALTHMTKIFEMKECQFPVLSPEDGLNFHEFSVTVSLGYDDMFDNIRRHIRHANTIIVGYMQSFRYFVEHEDLIRRCFQFNHVVKQNINNYFNHHLPKNRVHVGIHVRRGDFLWDNHQERGMSVANVSFFHKAMDLMQEKFPTALFIVASDDMVWAKKNLGDRAIMSPFNNYIYDLALLAGCQHSIISSGTFSWWTGWLANGTTVYYSEYPRKGSTLEESLKRSDYYCKHWIPLGD